MHNITNLSVVKIDYSKKLIARVIEVDYSHGIILAELIEYGVFIEGTWSGFIDLKYKNLVYFKRDRYKGYVLIK